MSIADQPYAELMKAHLGEDGELVLGMLKAAKVLPPERVAMMNTVAVVALASRDNLETNAKALDALRAFVEEARWKAL